MSDLAIAQIMSCTVGLMGALVAGLSVYFTYRGRHNQFRQVVYGRQMDAYFDISEAMSNLYTAAQFILKFSNPWVGNEDARARLRTSLRDEHERFIATVNRALIVLPSKVKAAVDNFNQTLLSISSPTEDQLDSSAGAEMPANPEMDLNKAYAKAVDCIRHHLAIDRLTTGMLKEMGIGSESMTVKNPRSGVKPLVSVGRAR